MALTGGWLLPAVWATLAATIVVCALRASRHPQALRIGLAAVSALWLLAGAGANAWMLADGSTYSGFADGSPIPFVRNTWESLVVPHHHLFIGLLIAGEALAGLLVLVPGRIRELALFALIAFNATLVVFGWGLLVWAVPLVTSLALLRRACRLESQRLRNLPRRPSGGASSGRHRTPRSRVPSP